jgi:drug/metabolite transporter superfamily protein YnfA
MYFIKVGCFLIYYKSVVSRRLPLVNLFRHLLTAYGLMLPVLLDLKFVKIYTMGVFLVLAFFWAVLSCGASSA